jgi:uroporphyrinogen-III synthase
MSGADPLNGRGVLITRPLEHSEPIAASLRAAGARAILFPTIAIEPVPHDVALHGVLSDLDHFDLAIFVSETAATLGCEAVFSRGRWPVGLRAAAIGQSTARALERAGLQGVLAPTGQADSEALLALAPLQDMRGKRVLVFRGQGGREWLRQQLETRGAAVCYAECYRRTRPSDADVAGLMSRWEQKHIDAVLLTSIEGLSNFFAMLPVQGAEYLRATPVFVPHPRIAQAAQELGVRTVRVAGAGDERALAEMRAFFAKV